MPSNETLQLIEESLAEGEVPDDLAAMVELLTRLRTPFHPGVDRQHIEDVTGLLICLVSPMKPEKYRDAMRDFRLEFRGISRDNGFKAFFVGCVRPAAWVVDKDEIDWTPSLYFTHPRSFAAPGVVRERLLAQGQPEPPLNWF